MAKEVSCYNCGFDYARKESSRCPKCGEIKIFNPVTDDPSYDFFNDVPRFSKYKLITALIALFIFGFIRIILGK